MGSSDTVGAIQVSALRNSELAAIEGGILIVCKSQEMAFWTKQKCLLCCRWQHFRGLRKAMYHYIQAGLWWPSKNCPAGSLQLVVYEALVWLNLTLGDEREPVGLYGNLCHTLLVVSSRRMPVTTFQGQT